MRRYIFKRSGLDSVGGGSLISHRSDGRCFSNKKGRRTNTASLNHFCMYSTIPQPRAPFFATKLLPRFHACRGQIPEESTSGLTYRLNSSAQLFCLTKTDERKIVGKLQRLANMKLT